MILNQNLTQPKSAVIPNNLTDVINSLSNNLISLAPNNSQTKFINYVLIAMAITGIFVYHYIKNQEES